MGDTLMGHGVHGGIAEDGLAGAGGGGVALIARLGVSRQQIADARQAVHEGQGLGGAFLPAPGAAAVRAAGEAEAAADLIRQQAIHAVKVGRHMMPHGGDPHPARAKKAGEQGGAQPIHDFTQHYQGRHGRAVGRTVPHLVQRRRMAEAFRHRVDMAHGFRAVMPDFWNILFALHTKFLSGLRPSPAPRTRRPTRGGGVLTAFFP